MGHSKDLNKFEHVTLIGCHWCNKLACEISTLLDIPSSNVSGVIAKE